MAEKVILAAPIEPAPTPEYTVCALNMDWREARIEIVLTDGPKDYHFHYSNSEATALMIALNKANMTTKSLQRRAIEKLQADGKLPAGAISGSPD